jgi:putative sugar O-methyltransferase
VCGTGVGGSMIPAIQEMFDCLNRGNEVYLPSKFWQQLNEQNAAQLEADGMRNIKRTLAQNYFTWVVGLRSPLFRHLAKLTGFRGWIDVLRRLPAYDSGTGLSCRRFYEFWILSRMIWRLAEGRDVHGILRQLREPEFGNPFTVRYHDRLISQDLANSVLELHSILDAQPRSFGERFTVCGLGAGYGRNAFVFLSVFKNCKYIIVDIPPALYVSQEYLATVFPNAKIMRSRCFDRIDDVREEFEQANVVFLLPHQAEQLASKSVDIFVNISSLHEMTVSQISAYFGLIDRLTCGHFYMKQWKSFTNTRDGITIRQEDYPYFASWSQTFSRDALTHPAFFEAAYLIGSR